VRHVDGLGSNQLKAPYRPILEYAKLSQPPREGNCGDCPLWGDESDQYGDYQRIISDF